MVRLAGEVEKSRASSAARSSAKGVRPAIVRVGVERLGELLRCVDGGVSDGDVQDVAVCAAFELPVVDTLMFDEDGVESSEFGASMAETLVVGDPEYPLVNRSLVKRDE